MKSNLMYLGLVCVLVHANMPGQETRPERSQRQAAYHAVVDYWLQGEKPELPNKCGLPAISYALQHRGRLDRAAASSLALLSSRPVTQTSILVGNFRVHYDTTGSNTPFLLNAQHNPIPGTADRYADSVAAVANHVLAIEHDSLGFLPPPADNAGGGPEYDIYIQDLGGSFYGYTTPETAINNKQDGGTYTTFLVIDNTFNFVYPDSNKGLPAMRVTLAHELHHAIQIGNYGYWLDDTYFYEITSVWMEDVVYSEVNDYYQYLASSQGHFRHPDVPFTSNDFIMYSRGIWGMFVAKRFGAQSMRRAWEYIQSYRPLEAMDNALVEVGSGFRQAFGEWGVWNFYTGVRNDPVKYYPEGAYYPLVLENAKGYAPPSRTVNDSLRCLATRYYDVVGGQTALKLITSNINIPAALTGNASYYPFTYWLNESNVDGSYIATASRIYVKFDVADRLNWVNVVDTSAISIVLPPLREAPFPNPFRPNGMNAVRIPVNAQTTGTLSIFSSSMDLIYSLSAHSSYAAAIGQQVFEWNGKNNDGRFAATGIYVYVLVLPNQTITGKFALIRK